jgi:hypothetical protein
VNSLWELSLLAMKAPSTYRKTALSFIASKLSSHRSTLTQGSLPYAISL